MEITADTELTDILNSNNVIENIGQNYNGIENTITTRLSNLVEQVNSAPIQNSFIDGKAIMADKGTCVEKNFSDFHIAFEDLVNQIKIATANKELEELTELNKKVSVKIEELNGKIQQKRNEMLSEINCIIYPANSAAYETANSQIRNNYQITIDGIKKQKEAYEEKLVEIVQRINNIPKIATNSLVFENEIPAFKIGKDGKIDGKMPDFVVDSRHRLDLPGFGICREACGDNKLVFHYDEKTNMFYGGDEDTDWSTFDYAADEIYAITPEEMQASVVKGGIVPW